ncbi:C-reactive protein-like [Mantella aurantiaca]
MTQVFSSMITTPAITSIREDQDLKGKVFVFPKLSYTDHVTITANITKPLREVSVCLHSYSDPAGAFSLLSLASPSQTSAFYISEHSSSFSVTINGTSNEFKPVGKVYMWRPICVTWTSDTGVIQLWINGRLSPRRVSMKGASIVAETSVLLGQKQDSFEGRISLRGHLLEKLVMSTCGITS